MINLEVYDIFEENKTTFKETSKDDSDASQIQYMTESERRVIDFDAVKTCYANRLGCTEETAASADALTVLKNRITFVEFKNGKVNNRNVKDKLRDSLLIFCDIVGKTITYTRENIDFMVVYNLEKNPLPNQMKKGKMQESPSRIAIGEYFSAKAKEDFILFDLGRYEKIYFSVACNSHVAICNADNRLCRGKNSK